jgi:hypothetical protein
MTESLTYKGDPSFKEAFLRELGKHEAADALIKGTYGQLTDDRFRGCGVGCSLASLNVLAGQPVDHQTSHHARYPTELGWPLWLAHLEDHVFERLPYGLYQTWPRRLSEAVPVGIVIPNMVLARVLRWCLADATYGVRHATLDAAVVAIVDRVVALFDRVIAGDEPTPEEWGVVTNIFRTSWLTADGWITGDARTTWTAWTAGAAWTTRASVDARTAEAVSLTVKGTSDAWTTLASDGEDGWTAIKAIRDGFYQALSEYLIAELRALEPTL